MNLEELKKNSKLNQTFKLNNRCLIAGLIMILISTLLFGWAYVISTRKLSDPENFADLVANQTSKEGIYAELNVMGEPSVFAEYDDSLTSEKYYFLWNGIHFYIGYLDYSTYTELKTKTTGVNSHTITGLTKKVPADVRGLAIEAYNEAFGEAILTEDNFDELVGSMYIDVVTPVHDNEIQIIAGIIFITLGLIILCVYWARHHQTKKGMKSRTETEWKRIFSELDSEETKSYKKLSLYLTENYIVDLSSGIRIVEYKDIVWMYQFQMKRYGITVNKNIVLVTKNKEKVSIANMDNFMKRSKKEFTEIMNFIISKNESIVLGYTKENRKQMKDLYGIK